MLRVQQWHGLSDPELEHQCIDCISFRKFLGFPKRMPEDTTVWAFREIIAKSGKEEKVWNEMQRQLDCIRLKIRKARMDLSEERRVVYRDKGYFGETAKGFAATMQRVVRGKPLDIDK
jgi:IS5 family transposase